jgi:hypothetical protein
VEFTYDVAPFGMPSGLVQEQATLCSSSQIGAQDDLQHFGTAQLAVRTSRYK